MWWEQEVVTGASEFKVLILCVACCVNITRQSHVKCDEKMTDCTGGCHQTPEDGADEMKPTHITVVWKLRQ